MNTTFHMILIPSHVVNLENVILGRISLWPMPWHLKEGKAGSSSDFCKSIHSWAQSFPDVYRNILYIIYPMVLEYIYIYTYVDVQLPWAIWELVWLKQPGVFTCFNMLCFEEKGWEPRFSKSDMGIQTCDIHIQFDACDVMPALFPNLFTSKMQVNHYANRRKFPQQKQTNDTVSWLKKKSRPSFTLVSPKLVGGFNPLEKIWVKLDHFPKVRGEN